MMRRPDATVGVMAALVLVSVMASSLNGQTDPRTVPEAIDLPGDAVTFQSGPGVKIAAAYCLMCHSADYIYMQPRFDAHRWRAIVRHMREAFACPIPEEEVGPLVDYLMSQSDRTPLPISSTAPSPRETAAPGRATKGQPLYERHCINCHGPKGKGDGPIGQALIPPAADLTSKEVRQSRDEELLRIIRNGKPPFAMPAWKHILTEDEIRDVLAYVRTLSGHKQ